MQGKAASPIFRLKEELVGMIVRLSGAWPAGRAGREDGVVRLLGGGIRGGVRGDAGLACLDHGALIAACQDDAVAVLE